MRQSIIILISIVFTLNACQNVPQMPQSLNVEQVVKENIQEWDISVSPRKDKNKWVYDTQLEYLGNTPVKVTLTNYDKTKITYNGMEPLVPAPTFGSADYKESVYSKENSILEFELEWEAQGAKKFGKTVFEIRPK
ncbi:hypothetical protein V1499_06140 [Neobacillus sp. SCS-31]|uniref:hypothetical protein n=1 Tax=Neobacillus oceani TaxID=3115292 RepID=UPI00390653E6